MGCCSSSNKTGENMEQNQRRRLSVGHMEAADGNIVGDTSEENRGLITSLNEQTALEMLEHTEGRKFSVGSDTDQGKTSYANKTVKQLGDEVDTVNEGLGFTCRKGLKPESPNQDSWFVLKVDSNFSIYAVFDGHGQKGHDVSNFVKENLPKLIIKDKRFKTANMGDMLIDVFKQMQSLIATADRLKKLSAQMSGTTATVVIHDHADNKLTVAHVADSTAVLGSGSNQALNALQLTRDHKPNLEDERARIEKNGGRVVFDGYANHRVYAKNGRYPGLNMSRCLGDLMGHQDCGITAEPEVSERMLDATDTVLLVCSDGVWEFLTPTDALAIVSEFAPEKAMPAAEKLAKAAWDKWITEEGGAVVDDITVVLVNLKARNTRAEQPTPADEED